MGVVTKLNFVNFSHDFNNSKIVIFQKNVATSYDELAVAWKTIENCGVGSTHPFDYPWDVTVNAIDSYGNHTRKLLASPGQAFEVKLSHSGYVIRPSHAPAANSQEIEVLNTLARGSINVGVYRNNKLLAMKNNVVPKEKAVFQFEPTLWIGIASEVQLGGKMNSAVLSCINTEICLLGIAEADIEMRGGGAGISSHPYSFILTNVHYL
ncbi:MAG: hypothetical protein IPK14_23250 [Blastocatellia bacterium]|nr:hypothetical protein [Blastocatellia bacterium]MBL8192300.1 hypothetical protein [Blastocatellia bacterium]MBN8723005.1 hypothetical protein [Acidobacteriota bacterium]